MQRDHEEEQITLNENCLLTIAQVNQELRQRLPRKLAIHNCTVARTLESMLYRVKLARPPQTERNRPDVLQKRVDYANWFSYHAVVNHSIFVDECGTIFGKQEVTDE